MAHAGGFTVWLTGMLGAGKTTMANYIAARMRQVGRKVEVLDEDELREDLWKELSDSKEDRSTVIRRLGAVANLLSRNDVAVLVAATSPYKSVRDENRRLIGRYIEVFMDCATEKLMQRDTTGKYKKALSGEIPNFIGITEPYEPPPANSAEVVIRSDLEPVDEGARRILQALLDLSCVGADELKVITGKKMKANPLPKARRPAKGARPAPKAHAARAAKPKAAGKRKGR